MTDTTIAPPVDTGRGTAYRAGMHLAWLQRIKGVALLWIALAHVIELVFGFVAAGNPGEEWGSLGDRIQQLEPLPGFGPWNWPVNAARWLGWAGDQGVALFIVASGFGLTWSLLAPRPRPLDVRDFFGRRLARLLPLWFAVHAVFLMLAVVGIGPMPIGPRLLISLVGFRMTTSMFYFGAPAWWFFGLLLQLYLVFPFLWSALRRFGAARLLLVASAAALAVRGVGLVALGGTDLPIGIDAWSRGALFPTRLPEFVFGIALAAWLYEHPERLRHALRSRGTLLSAVLTYLAGVALSFGLLGMTVAPFMVGASGFFLLWALFERAGSGGRVLSWTGRHSYSLFLVHHPVILALVPSGRGHGLAGGGRVVAAIGVTVVMALALERFASRLVDALVSARRRLGTVRTAAACAALPLAAWGPLVVADWFVRVHDPQEADGWGERPSLRPDDDFGWTLRPSTTTHLRWLGYDYTVTANALGFPGPTPSPARTPGVDRVLVIGDAYTSAEGVDTDQAWPRLLESALPTLTGRDVEVLNFAITGYGPNQYLPVLERFVPEYRPDVVVLAMSFTDFDDALKTDDEFRREAGFARPGPDSVRSRLELSQLRTWIDLRVKEPLRAVLLREPEATGRWFGGIWALERDHLPTMRDGAAIAVERLRRIVEVTDAARAQLVALMIPPPVTACAASELPYFPRHTDLDDGARFDLGQVERLTEEAMTAAGITRYESLHGPLADAASCPYQPANLHWTEDGHRTVAEHVARTLTPSLVP